jgi:hypothetical protein
MFADDTIGDLRKLLVTSLPATEHTSSFELRAAFPPNLLDDSLSMMEAGLTPNGVVHCRKPN